MKISSVGFLSAACAALIFVLPASASSPDRGRANALYATHGLLYVDAAGPYVERGTYRVQVLAKLGEPSERLSEDTWLYPGHRIESVGLEGVLVVRLRAGRVQSLAIASPATVAALRTARAAAESRLAGKN